MSINGKMKPKPMNNCHYYIKRLNGEWSKGVVVDSRINELDEMECFVHYHGLDKRLDEWVSANSIDVDKKLDAEALDTSQVPILPDSRLTRNQKRKFHDINHLNGSEEHLDGYTQVLEKEHQEFTRVKYIEKIRLGPYEINTWYFSPYPKEYKRMTKLWICEYCLKYMRLEKTFYQHMNACKRRNPPGKEIYRKDTLSVFEIDGADEELYCQNLCLLAKLFLDHKTLYYDVLPFMFYVLCEIDVSGYHLVGYFSKEKFSAENNNLACIMTLPPFQRLGYGKFLIGFSYELAKLEKCVGGPEKPLSDLGRLSYRSYWEYSIFNYLLNQSQSTVYVEEISNATAIDPADVASVLEAHSLLKHHRMGKFVDISPRELQEFVIEYEMKKPVKVDPNYLKWTPPTKH